VYISDDIKRPIANTILRKQYFTMMEPTIPIIYFVDSMVEVHWFCDHCKETHLCYVGSIYPQDHPLPKDAPSDLGRYFFCTGCESLYPTSDRSEFARKYLQSL